MKRFLANWFGEREKEYEPEKTVRILCIDGGGIRGLIPAVALEELEQLVGQKCGDIFHLIAGTSTGGLMALGLTKPDPFNASELVDFYSNHGRDIFKRSMVHAARSLGGYLDDLYQTDSFEALLREKLGNNWLSSSSPETLVTAYDIERRQPRYFSSWKARGDRMDVGTEEDACDFLLPDLARAITAAPSYFRPALIQDRCGATHPLIDGGVFANNPAIAALMEARVLFPKAENILLVSLGTGTLERPIEYKKSLKFGKLDWIEPVMSIMASALDQAIDRQLSLDLGDEDYFRFQSHLLRFDNDTPGPSDDFDDVTPGNIDRLKRRAAEMLDWESPRMEVLVERLKKEARCDMDKLV
jgi:uncharacterized protein